VGQVAERSRKEKAVEWLGREMPPWSQKCPIKVTLTMGGSGGSTTFMFNNGRVIGQHMQVEGRLDRILASVIPHEVTHTVFAFHFGQPLPRWADEGGAVLSEDELERNRHAQQCQQILNTPGRAMPLRRLLPLREYPTDLMVLYSQGYSLTEFLVSKSSKPAFLNFVSSGMQQGWDRAVQTHYGYQRVEDLEQEWVTHCLGKLFQPRPGSTPNVPQPLPIGTDLGARIGELRDGLTQSQARLDSAVELVGRLRDQVQQLQQDTGQTDGRLATAERVLGTVQSGISRVQEVAPKADRALELAGQVADRSNWLLLLSTLLGGGSGAAVAGAARLLGLFGKARSVVTTVSAMRDDQRPSVVIRENPPPPQVIREETKYVTVEGQSTELAALKAAMDSFVQKHPGAVSSVETIKAYAAQIESGMKGAN
jgi:hypothetical protein